MSKTYLLAYNAAFGTTESVKELLNQIVIVSKWRYDMSNCFYLVPEATAEEIATKLRTLQPKGRFIVTEIPSNSNGWLTKQSWHLIQKKEYMPKPS